jgi:hypothetical protein
MSGDADSPNCAWHRTRPSLGLNLYKNPGRVGTRPTQSREDLLKIAELQVPPSGATKANT